MPAFGFTSLRLIWSVISGLCIWFPCTVLQQFFRKTGRVLDKGIQPTNYSLRKRSCLCRGSLAGLAFRN